MTSPLSPASATQAPALAGRGPCLGVFPGMHDVFDASRSLAFFRQSCFNRFFELKVFEAVKARRIQVPVYLCAGQEHIPAAIAQVFPAPMIFAQHRGHAYYLSFGGSPAALRDELLGLSTGCAGGKGGSASIHDPGIRMFGHSGLMGDQVPIAVGAALASGRRTLTVTGDASVEEDYVFGAMGYAVTKKAPVLFICEDNNFSILTPVPVRRTWNMTEVARSLGMPAEDITDDPWLIAHHVQEMRDRLPAFLNIRTCRQLWHAGAGCDGPPEWDRFRLIQEELDRQGLGEARRTLEAELARDVDRLWAGCGPAS